MKYRTWPWIVLSVCMLFHGISRGGQLDRQHPFPFSTFELKNGLTVILAQDGTLPVVTIAVAYKVGSMHEDLDKAGLAYFLENLMFEGSRNVSRMQHVRFIQSIGGRLNAVTERDRTIFYQTVPSHHLTSILWLESDRMTSLSINQANVDFWKSTLKSGLKMRSGQDPYQNGSRIFDALLYPDYAINHPPQGTSADLDSITVADVRDFYQTYYRPNNAVLCIVGNIDLNRTDELVRKYFQGLPRGPDVPPAPTARDSDFEITDVTETVDSLSASAPGFFLGYRIPKARSDDFYALTLIEYILMRGNSSRLYQRLIKREERLASQLSGGIDIRHDQAAFLFIVFSSNELKKERCQKEISSEINKLKSSLVSEKELLKAKNVFKRDYVNRYATSADKTLFLTNAFLSGIPWIELSSELDRYLSVTAPRIMYTMGRYFEQDRVLVNIKTR
ncbi:MAG: pitrilysin family protein [Candidatus Aminicenantaceae bacterium]